MRAVKAIQRADVVLLVLDALDGPTTQDTHVASYALEENKGIVLVVNKWDGIEEETKAVIARPSQKLFRDILFTFQKLDVAGQRATPVEFSGSLDFRHSEIQR